MPMEYLFSWVFTLPPTLLHITENVDWFIFCRRCSIARYYHPRHSTELTGHLGLLSSNYFSASCPVDWHPNFHPVHLVQPSRVIHRTYLGRLGQWPLVLEFNHQYYLRCFGDIATAMGASLSKGCLPTIQPSQTSAPSCILCKRG